MAARNTLRRSLLYVPGSSQRFLDKSRSLVADCIAYDLEDSVTPHKKAEARTLVRRAIDQPIPSGLRERAVRINSVDSGLALGDLTEVLQSPNLSTIVIPKVNSASDLTFVHDVSAQSLTNLREICAATPLLQGLIFAAEDFALRPQSHPHSLPDGIPFCALCHPYKSEKADGSPPAALEEECQSGRRLGFDGKQCIHPTQVKTVNAIFGPDAEETVWAMRVVVADEKAAAAGRGRGRWMGR
ncbi:hypothetical protein N7470_002706 [Penicillium chermesinum]|nr:hypothetical protein N7470_002706 [Penicillium chermesinum]